jgi:hypothetical protein
VEQLVIFLNRVLNSFRGLGVIDRVLHLEHPLRDLLLEHGRANRIT